jgi:glycosyltransferase involved in cell wall biosynthesis
LSGWRRNAISQLGVWASYGAARRADGIVTKSRNLRDALPAGVPATRVRIIPNGVDLTRFRPLDRAACRVRLGWSARDFHVLFPANTGDPRKRPWIARAAIERLRAHGVPAELHALSGVPHAEVPEWINAADAVILTSLAEGSPNIVKEALACDVAVVSVDVGDVAERLEGVAGCHIAAAEPAALAARLADVHAAANRRIEGRAVMQELSIERVAERLRGFYEEVLAGAPAG